MTTTSAFDAALATFLSLAQAMVDAHMAKEFPNNPRKVLSAERGKRYVRIVVSDDGVGRSAYCFVDTTNGDVLKSEGWKAPAKGPRGNIFAENPIAGVTPYGAARAR